MARWWNRRDTVEPPQRLRDGAKLGAAAARAAREVAARAHSILRRIGAAHPDFLKQGIAPGLAVTAAFHARLRAAFPAWARAGAPARRAPRPP